MFSAYVGFELVEEVDAEDALLRRVIDLAERALEETGVVGSLRALRLVRPDDGPATSPGEVSILRFADGMALHAQVVA